MDCRYVRVVVRHHHSGFVHRAIDDVPMMDVLKDEIAIVAVDTSGIGARVANGDCRIRKCRHRRDPGFEPPSQQRASFG
jgi:hypothetical protein